MKQGELGPGKLRRLAHEGFRIGSSGQSYDLQTVRMLPDNLQSLPADAAGRAENDETLHGKIVGGCQLLALV